MNFIRNQRFFLPNILVGLCILVFVFIVRQNSAKADTRLEKPEYSSNSMTEFLNQKGMILLNQNIEKSKKDYQNYFDMYSDYSLQKYIFDSNPLKNKRYIPSDLVQIDSEHIVNRAGRPYLRRPSQLAFEKLSKDFYFENNQQLYLISAYRSYSDQATLFEGGCSSNRCAKIGASEHQLGLAVDVHLATKNGYNILGGKYLDRLNQNAHKYGFINTYRKGYKIDGKISEVWHWRYVGIPLATELFEKDLSFAEYYNTNVVSNQVEKTV